MIRARREPAVDQREHALRRRSALRPRRHPSGGSHRPRSRRCGGTPDPRRAPARRGSATRPSCAGRPSGSARRPADRRSAAGARLLREEAERPGGPAQHGEEGLAREQILDLSRICACVIQPRATASRGRTLRRRHRTRGTARPPARGVSCPQRTSISPSAACGRVPTGRRRDHGAAIEQELDRLRRRARARARRSFAAVRSAGRPRRCRSPRGCRAVRPTRLEPPPRGQRGSDHERVAERREPGGAQERDRARRRRPPADPGTTPSRQTTATGSRRRRTGRPAARAADAARESPPAAGHADRRDRRDPLEPPLALAQRRDQLEPQGPVGGLRLVEEPRAGLARIVARATPGGSAGRGDRRSARTSATARAGAPNAEATAITAASTMRRRVASRPRWPGASGTAQLGGDRFARIRGHHPLPHERVGNREIDDEALRRGALELRQLGDRGAIQRSARARACAPGCRPGRRGRRPAPG